MTGGTARRTDRTDRRMRRGSFTPPREIERGRALLWVTAVGAGLYAAVSAIATVATVVTTFLGESVRLDLPVGAFWPPLKPSVQLMDPPPAHVIAGGFDTAHVSVAGLDLSAKLWLAGGQLLAGATYTVIAVVVAMLCVRLLHGRAFDQAASRSMFTAATAILVGGLGWQLCLGIGDSSASRQVLGVTGWGISEKDISGGISEIGWPEPTTVLDIEFWPVFIALALAAVGIAFRYGAQVHQERERAVRTAERLRRDAEGLV